MARKVFVGSMLAILLLSVPARGAGLESPEPLSPGSRLNVETVAQECPTFSWSLVPRAAAYRLVVYEVTAESGLGEAVIRRRLSAGASSWTPPLRLGLRPGKNYAWTVGAVAPKGETLWSDPAFFEVAGTPSREEIERAFAVLEAAYGDRRTQEAEETPPSGSIDGEAAAEPPSPGSAPAAPLPIYLGPMVRFEGGRDVTPAFGGTLVLGSNSSYNLAFDNNEIMARNAGSATRLYLNREGGQIWTGGPLLADADVDLMGHDLWNVGKLQLGHTIRSARENCLSNSGSLVLCPTGWKVLGGGCFSGTRDQIIGSYPHGDVGWLCRVDAGDNLCEGATAYAVCADLR